MRPPDPMLLQAFALLNSGQEQQALTIFRQLAAQGDPGALATMAELTWSGGLIPRSFEEGYKLYRRADAAGHAGCAHYVTNLMATGSVGKRDWAQAIKRLQREAAVDPARAEAARMLAGLDLFPNGNPRSVPQPEMLHKSPDIKLFRSAFSHEECAYILRVAKPDYKRAFVTDQATGEERIDPVRTADETHVHWLIENPLLHAFNRRLAALSGTRPDQGEPMQILRYRPGQQYLSHYDYIPGAKNQRILTALIYLNEDYTGGETSFTRLGIKVRGRIGDVLLFPSVMADGRREVDSEHAGLPVTDGVKLIVSRWIRADTHQPF